MNVHHREGKRNSNEYAMGIVREWFVSITDVYTGRELVCISDELCGNLVQWVRVNCDDMCSRYQGPCAPNAFYSVAAQNQSFVRVLWADGRCL